MDAPDYLKLDHQLCFALYAAHRAMLKQYTPLLEPLGLTYPQYLVLLVLIETDNVPIKILCDRLFLDTGTLTPLLKRMEKNRWIKRLRNPLDERQVLISLDTNFTNHFDAIKEIPLKLCSAYPCEHQELHHLKDALHQLNQALSPNT